MRISGRILGFGPIVFGNIMPTRPTGNLSAAATPAPPPAARAAHAAWSRKVMEQEIDLQ